MRNGSRLEFEQGPIRPPNEARSLLIRVTRNCPWNQCMFCPIYKGRKFSLRKVEEVKKDMQTARDIADDIKSLSWQMGEGRAVTEKVVKQLLSSGVYSQSYKSVALWLYYGTGECFLQDADNFVLKTKYFADILKFLREKFPELSRVTTYSRSRTISRRSSEEVREIKEAGLDRVHIGLESGSDRVLKFIKKGVTAARHIDAGRKVLDAGMSLSEYIMPGLGGQDMWREHAMETAKVINRINPNYIRLRSLAVPFNAPLYQKLEEGEFKIQTDDRIVEEIKLFIQNLERITSTLTSDHILNLLDIRGKFPEDKEKMLKTIKEYQELPESERIIYRIGRRGGAYSSIKDLQTDPVTYEKIKSLVSDLSAKGSGEVDRFIADMASRYI